MAINGNYTYGSSGDAVKAIQTQLNDWGATQKEFVPLKVDGIFGGKTGSALKNFQTTAGITSDGIYGNQTAGAFAKTNVMPNATTTQTTPVVATPTPTVPVATSPYDMKFDYNAAGDNGLKAASNLANSRIAEEMAARGIGGSTIEQERIAQSLAGLNLDYRNQAYQQFQGDRATAIQKYETDYKIQRQAKEDAWNTAQETGIFNNEQARLWGLNPGTLTNSEKARRAQIEQQNADRQAEVQIAQAKAQAVAVPQEYVTGSSQTYKDILKSFPTVFATTKNPKNAVNNILEMVKNGSISPDEAMIILQSATLPDGVSAYELAEDIANGTNNSGYTD